MKKKKGANDLDEDEFQEIDIAPRTKTVQQSQSAKRAKTVSAQGEASGSTGDKVRKGRTSDTTGMEPPKELPAKPAYKRGFSLEDALSQPFADSDSDEDRAVQAKRGSKKSTQIDDSSESGSENAPKGAGKKEKKIVDVNFSADGIDCDASAMGGVGNVRYAESTASSAIAKLVTVLMCAICGAKSDKVRWGKFDIIVKHGGERVKVAKECACRVCWRVYTICHRLGSPPLQWETCVMNYKKVPQFKEDFDTARAVVRGDEEIKGYPQAVYGDQSVSMGVLRTYIIMDKDEYEEEYPDEKFEDAKKHCQVGKLSLEEGSDPLNVAILKHPKKKFRELEVRSVLQHGINTKYMDPSTQLMASLGKKLYGHIRNTAVMRRPHGARAGRDSKSIEDVRESQRALKGVVVPEGESQEEVDPDSIAQVLSFDTGIGDHELQEGAAKRQKRSYKKKNAAKADDESGGDGEEEGREADSVDDESLPPPVEEHVDDRSQTSDKTTKKERHTAHMIAQAEKYMELYPIPDVLLGKCAEEALAKRGDIQRVVQALQDRSLKDEADDLDRFRKIMLISCGMCKGKILQAEWAAVVTGYKRISKYLQHALPLDIDLEIIDKKYKEQPEDKLKRVTFLHSTSNLFYARMCVAPRPALDPQSPQIYMITDEEVRLNLFWTRTIEDLLVPIIRLEEEGSDLMLKVADKIREVWKIPASEGEQQSPQYKSAKSAVEFMIDCYSAVAWLIECTSKGRAVSRAVMIKVFKSNCSVAAINKLRKAIAETVLYDEALGQYWKRAWAESQYLDKIQECIDACNNLEAPFPIDEIKSSAENWSKWSTTRDGNVHALSKAISQRCAAFAKAVKTCIEAKQPMFCTIAHFHAVTDAVIKVVGHVADARAPLATLQGLVREIENIAKRAEIIAVIQKASDRPLMTEDFQEIAEIVKEVAGLKFEDASDLRALESFVQNALHILESADVPQVSGMQIMVRLILMTNLDETHAASKTFLAMNRVNVLSKFADELLKNKGSDLELEYFETFDNALTKVQEPSAMKFLEGVKHHDKLVSIIADHADARAKFKQEKFDIEDVRLAGKMATLKSHANGTNSEVLWKRNLTEESTWEQAKVEAQPLVHVCKKSKMLNAYNECQQALEAWTTFMKQWGRPQADVLAKTQTCEEIFDLATSTYYEKALIDNLCQKKDGKAKDATAAVNEISGILEEIGAKEKVPKIHPAIYSRALAVTSNFS